MAEEKGSPMSDGEAFHSQLRDMMNSSTNKNGMSTVDLEESSPQSFGSLSLDDSEGPFKAPTPSSMLYKLNTTSFSYLSRDSVT